tara:strand:+ start:128 stop:2587 length:2460 start_codon:yes stop_codon:yes gene_type:complete
MMKLLVLHPLMLSSIPTVTDMAGDWVDLSHPLVSLHVNTTSLDLPIISNFHGSVGSNPNGDFDLNPDKGGVSHRHVTPVDLFAINSFEVPPFAGCGNSLAHHTPSGCGRMLLGGNIVSAEATKYAAFEFARRATTSGGSLSVSSKTRMLFEDGGVLWQINFTNSASEASAKQSLVFELTAMVREYSHVAWVQNLPYNPHNFTYTVINGVVGTSTLSSLHGIVSVGKGDVTTPSPHGQSRPAASIFAIVDDGAGPSSIGIDATTNVPSATYAEFTVPAHASRTLSVVFAVGTTVAAAEALAGKAAATQAHFDASWAAAQIKWEARWQSAFDPSDSYFSGAVPTLTLAGAEENGVDATAAGVARVYYASVLSIVSQMRTNLPLLNDKVWPTSQGNNEALERGGVVIGGAISYFWDEALSSMLLALLEPASRRPTYHAWFTSDLRGRSHNWFDLDCGNNGTNPAGTVYGQCNFTGAHGKAAVIPAGKVVYPYNIWSFGVAMFNYIHTSNDTGFLDTLATNGATKSTLTVEEALEGVVNDWKDVAIDGTRLADYGTTLDGFSRTYEHVMPGMQGNNIWMLRKLAALRELQGKTSDAAILRSEATGMARETIETMYATSADKKRGWWNVIWPTGPNGTKPLQAYEMRHIVDFFSIAFGMCGIKGVECDLDATQREQLSTFFHEELQTSDWIRATSPACNCSNNYPVEDGGRATGAQTDAHVSAEQAENSELGRSAGDAWPGLVSCAADREDHGTTGAYTAWPGFAGEALCYIEGNCTSAFKLMGSFAPNTRQGAFGQANAVPQQLTPPYTPFNEEPAYKPSDRR